MSDLLTEDEAMKTAGETMFDSLTLPEHRALHSKLSDAHSATSKVTLALGDISIKTLQSRGETESHIWATRERFKAMGCEIFALMGDVIP